jgi:hypothetical protein
MSEAVNARGNLRNERRDAFALGVNEMEASLRRRVGKGSLASSLTRTSDDGIVTRESREKTSSNQVPQPAQPRPALGRERKQAGSA